jgi:hypothetical protein
MSACCFLPNVGLPAEGAVSADREDQMAWTWLTGGAGLVTLVAAALLMAYSAPSPASHQSHTSSVVTTTAHMTSEHP